MGQVKVILRESIPGVGAAGDLVSVKPGHARNFLLPQGKAILATTGNVNALEHHQRVVAEKVSRELNDLTAVRDRLEALDLQVYARVGEEGKLFGSVTALQIAELIGEKGLAVDRRKISLAEPIKELGEFRVPIRLHSDLTAEVVLKVSAEE